MVASRKRTVAVAAYSPPVTTQNLLVILCQLESPGCLRSAGWVHSFRSGRGAEMTFGVALTHRGYDGEELGKRRT